MPSICSHFTVLAGLVLPTATQPDRWVHVGGSASSHDEYVDTHSLRRVGDTATLWTRRDFVQGRGTAWHELQFDCSARTETILSYIRDDGTSVTHNVARPHRAPAPIAAGSVEEKVFALACRSGPLPHQSGR